MKKLILSIAGIFILTGCATSDRYNVVPITQDQTLVKIDKQTGDMWYLKEDMTWDKFADSSPGEEVKICYLEDKEEIIISEKNDSIQQTEPDANVPEDIIMP